MSELLFAVKMAAITFVLVIVMQIRVGEETLENHAHLWIQTATPILFLREVAEGGLSAGMDAWSKITGGIKTKYWNKMNPNQIPGQRHLGIGLDRSEAFVEEQKLKAEALALVQQQKKEKVEAELAARAKRVREAVGLEDESEPTEESEVE